MKYFSERQIEELKDPIILCQQSAWAPVGLTIVFITIPATIKTFMNSPGLFFGSIFFSIVLTVLAWRIAKATLFNTNWVMKGTDQGLYLKIRSYLNFQLSPDDTVVVFIPFNEIRAAEEIEETHQSKGLFGFTKKDRRTHLNIILKDPEAGMILPLISEEVYRHPPEENPLAEKINHLHVQIQVPGPNIIQVPWHDRNTKIAPQLPKVLAILEKYGIAVNQEDGLDVAMVHEEDIYTNSVG